MANTNSDGSITISVNLDSDGAKKDLADIEKSCRRASNTVEQIGKKANPNWGYNKEMLAYVKECEKRAESSSKATNEMKKALEEAQAEVAKLEGEGKWFGDADYDDAVDKLNRIKGDIAEYKKSISVPPKKANPFGLDTLAGKLKDAEISLKRLESAGKGLGNDDYDKAYKNYVQLQKEAKAYRKKLEDDAVKESGDGAEKVGKKWQATAKKIADAFSQFGGKTAKNLGSAVTSVENLSASGAGLGDIAVIFSLITAAVKLAQLAVKAYTDQIEDTVKKVRELGDTIAETWKTSGTYAGGFKNLFGGVKDQLNETVNTLWSGYKAGLSFVTLDFKGFKDSMKDMQDSAFNTFKAKIQQLVSLLRMTAKLTTDIGGAPFRLMASGVKALASSLREAAAEALSRAWKELPSNIAALAHPAKLATNVIEKLRSTMAKLLGNFDETASKVKSTGQNLITRIASMLKTRVLRSLLSNVINGIKTGIQNLYQYMSGFSDSMNSLATDAQYLKNALASMLAPAINALAPIITFVVDKIVDFINVINMLISLLTGASTWTKAKRQAKSYGEAVGGAADNAERLNDNLSGLDEIHKWQSDTGGASGGAGSGTPDYSSMFSTENIDLSESGWGKTIADLITQLKDDIAKGDWEGVGGTIAEGFNFALNAADKFILEKLKPFGVKWAGNIARILNGAIEEFEWDTLGKTVADGLNTIAEVCNEFFEKFKAYEFGAGIAESINSMFAEIDPKEIGMLLANRLNAGLKITYGVIHELDWGPIGKKIGETLKTYFENLDINTLAKILGESLQGLIELAIELINSDAFTNLGSRLGKALETFLNSYRPDQSGASTKKFSNTIGSLIGTAFNNTVYNVRQFISSGALQSLAGAIGGELSDFFSTVDLPGVASAIGEAICAACESVHIVVNKINWGDLGSKIAQSFRSFLSTNTLPKIGTAIGEMMSGITQMISNFASSMTTGDWKALGTQIGDGITNLFSEIDWGSLGESLNSIGEGILTAINEAWEKVDKEQLINDISDFLDGLDWKTLRTDFVKTILGIIKDVALEWIKQKINNFIGDVFSLFNDEAEGEDGVNVDVNLNKNGWDSPSSWASSFGTKVSSPISLLQNGWNTVTNWVGRFGTKVTSPVSLAKSTGKDKWSSVTKWVEKIGTAVTSPVSLLKNGWDSVTKFAKDSGTDVTSNVSLLKNNWSSVSAWAKKTGTKVTSPVSLQKNNWSSVSDWTKKTGTKVTAPVSLQKNNWSSVTKWASNSGTSVSAWVALKKDGWTSLSSFIGSVSKTISLKIEWNYNIGDKEKLVWLTLLGRGARPSVRFAARGGIVDSATLFGNTIAGEAGKEAIIPLERHTEWIDLVAGRIVEMLGLSKIAESISAIADRMADIPRAIDGITDVLSMRSMTPPIMASGVVIPPQSTVKPGEIESLKSAIEELKAAIPSTRATAKTSNQDNRVYQFTAQINRRTLFSEVIAEARLRQTSTGMNPFLLR